MAADTVMVWAVDNPSARILIYLISALGWVALLTSTFLINHFELFGLQQVFNYWRGVRFNQLIQDPALYKYVRHPMYLGFILAFWASRA